MKMWETGVREETGVITTISKDVCVVSVNINGTNEALSFGKRLLYTWGNQCEGDMTNILDRGTEVNVCYRYSQYGNIPSVVAVWIGEKPVLSNRDVEPIYNQRGIVEQVFEDRSFIVRSNTDCVVTVREDSFFRDGCRSEGHQRHVTVGESVTFDAVSVEDGKDPCEGRYRATCAWVGKMPGLVDRFGLHVADSSAQDLKILTKDLVYGTVVVIPNNAVAFVYVEDAHEKVMLLRSSFKQKFERIQDAVEVGDKLCMRLRFSYIFTGCRQWFAESAYRNAEEVMHVISRVELEKSASPYVLFADEATSTSRKDKESKNGFFNEENEVLYSDPPLKGIIKIVSKGKTKVLISYEQLNIVARLSNLYLGNGSKKDQVELLFPNLVVNFEAVLRQSQKEKYLEGVKITHQALCVWIDQKPSLEEFAKNLNKKTDSLLAKSNVTFSGRVFTFYLPDIALVKVSYKNVVVCLHVSSFASCRERFKEEKYIISDFVRRGDSLLFNVRKDPAYRDFLCAVNVKLASNITNGKHLSDVRIQNGDSSELSNDESEDNTSSYDSHDTQSPKPIDENNSIGISVLCDHPSSLGVIRRATPVPKTCDVIVNDTEETRRVNSNQTNMLFSNKSKILWNDPPLTGVCRYLSVDKLIIVYKKLKVLFNPSNFYVDGIHVSRPIVDDFMSLCESKTVVNFEATKSDILALKKCDISHRTGLVWIGVKPSFYVIARSVGSADPEMLSKPEKMFVGIVAKFYFPDMAVLKIKKDSKNYVVGLDTQSFINKCQRSGTSIKGMECISDHVALQDKVEFKVKVKEHCQLKLWAYGARKLTKEEYDAVFNQGNAQ